MSDPVKRPQHYTHLDGLEAIDVCEQLNFCLGNAVKYILRCNHKGSKEQDLRKAIWYLERELVDTPTDTCIHGKDISEVCGVCDHG